MQTANYVFALCANHYAAPPHLERPGDPIVILCSTPHLPTAGCHTKDTPKRQCQRDMDEKKSLRQRDAEIFHLPYAMEAQASARILLRVRVPSLSIRQSRQWP